MVALLFVVILAALAYLTLSPPAGDGPAYYLPQSQLIALTHHITPMPLLGFNQLFHLSLNSEMHMAVMFLLGGDVIGEYAINMTLWITALASGAMLWAISSLVGLNRRGQWSVMAMLYTSTALTYVMFGGKTDVFSVGLGLAAIYWVLQVGKGPSWTIFLLTGLMAGLSINSKMSYIIALIPMLAILAVFCSWPLVCEKSTFFKARYFVKAAFIVGGAFVITLLPLFLKNAIVFNEPLAPFFYLHQLRNDTLNQIWYSPENTKWIVLTYPFALIFGQYPMQGGNISPLWLAFLPFLVCFPKNLREFSQPLAALTLSSVFGVVMWVLFFPSVLAPRYIMPVLLTLFPLGGYLVQQVWDKREYLMLRFMIISSISLMFLFATWGLSFFFQSTQSYWTASSRSFQEGVFKAMGLVNTKAEKGDRVFLATYDRYPLRSDLLQTLINGKDLSSFGPPNMWWVDIFRSGGRWVIASRATHSKIFPVLVNLKEVPDFLQVISYPIDNNYIVYQIVPKEGAPRPMKTSVEQQDGTWKVQDLTH